MVYECIVCRQELTWVTYYCRQCKKELTMARGLQDLQNLLPVQILVLSSLGLQFILFLCATVRRSETSIRVPVRLLLLWIAYNFGDIIATYTLARLSFFSTTGDHPLVVLWAPFLLLHLAGPDNIAAYALEDNQLSLRSMQTFFAQVTAGGYFLYTYRNISVDFLRIASRLMFALAVVKYGERWLALQRGNLGSISDSLKKKPVLDSMSHVAHPQDAKLMEIYGVETLDEESSVRRAHSLFHICKCGMVDSSEDESGRQNYSQKMKHVELWTIIEIELSFMYDILYTKAAVSHTWHGYTIRVILPLAILTSLLLFHFSEEDRDSREVDTVITYILFGSALFMEWTSLLNTLGSSWTFNTLSTTRCTWLRYKLLCSGQWDRLRRLVLSVNFLGDTCVGPRRWSGNMGQYNILHFCTRPNTLLTRPLLGSLAILVGLEESWNRKHFSGAINISDHVSTIKQCISEHINLLYTEGWLNTLGTVKHEWGMTTLLHRDQVDNFKGTLGNEFQEGIIIWHIGKDFFHSKCMSTNASVDLVNAIKALSNYMMFLLVERTYMLPGIAQNRLYQRTCKALYQGVNHCHPTSGICAVLKNFFRWRDDPAGLTSMASDSRTHAEDLYNKYVLKEFTYETVRLTYSTTVARKLLEHEEKHGTAKSLELLLDLWTDMLVYAGNKCSRESHAKKLSSGGELTTIVWLMVEHLHQGALVYDGEQASANEASSKEEYHHNLYRV
ncbi:unnamed protein product [Alopecurus aequalis]